MRDMTNQDTVVATVKLGDRDIEVRQPDEQQVYVLAQVSRMTQGEARVAFRGLGLFGGVLDGLFVNDEDLDWAYARLLDGGIHLDDYLELVPKIVEAFNLDLPEDDQRRPTGRAQAITKRPAARRKR